MKTKRARIDADGRAIPKTKLVAHVPLGHCVRGAKLGIVSGDNLELHYVNGEKIKLTEK